MPSQVLTTYLLYINVISQSGSIEEKVFSLQTFQPFSLSTKGEDILYIGEGDSMEIPLSLIYGCNETSAKASIQIVAKNGNSILSNQTGIPLSPHSSTKTSIYLTVRFVFSFYIHYEF